MSIFPPPSPSKTLPSLSFIFQEVHILTGPFSMKCDHSEMQLINKYRLSHGGLRARRPDKSDSLSRFPWSPRVSEEKRH